MNFRISAVFALSAALATGYAIADTRSSDDGSPTMEHKASPSNATHQDEERTEAHSQPDTPNPGGTGADASSSGTASSGASTSGGKEGDSSQAAKKPKVPNTGDTYQSNENKADSTMQKK